MGTNIKTSDNQNNSNSTPYHLCFETLSNELRMNILNSLKSSPRSVNELASELNIERSTVSHALSMLKLCSIVDMKKSGKNNVYSLHDKSMLNMKGDVLEVLDKHMEEFCGSCKKIENKIKIDNWSG